MTTTVSRYDNQRLEGILSYLRDQSTRGGPETKFVEAARYGATSGDVGKCEARYQCSVNLEIIKIVI